MTSTDYYKQKSVYICVTYFVKNNNLDIEFDFGAFPDRPYDSHIIFGDNKKISFIMNSSFPLEKPQQS